MADSNIKPTKGRARRTGTACLEDRYRIHKCRKSDTSNTLTPSSRSPVKEIEQDDTASIRTDLKLDIGQLELCRTHQCHHHTGLNLPAATTQIEIPNVEKAQDGIEGGKGDGERGALLEKLREEQDRSQQLSQELDKTIKQLQRQNKANKELCVNADSPAVRGRTDQFDGRFHDLAETLYAVAGEVQQQNGLIAHLQQTNESLRDQLRVLPGEDSEGNSAGGIV